MQFLSERRNPHGYLEKKAELAFQGDCAAQKRFSEADMDRINWEQRFVDIALNETNRELESQRLELYQETRLADQAQRESISLLDI